MTHPDDLRAWRHAHVPVFNDNKLKLGIFGMNCSNGCTITHAPTSFEPTYQHNVKIARLADRIGLELLVPVGRWKHFGGSTRFNANNLEVYTWATAMACNTEKLMVFATSHVPTVHPLLAAKQSATIDNISAGRFGLNIVCGWFRPEIEMFGIEQRDHDARYRMADEWLSVIKRAWTEQDFDHHGEFYDIKGGFLLPKPVQQPYPTLINAGSSEAGREFSARHVDYNFITITTEDEARFLIKDVKARAAAHQRECGVMTYGLVCCRDTEAEARELYDSIVRHGDWEATENIMKILGIESSSFGNQDTVRNLGERFIAGWGGYPLVGTPEQVVEKMQHIHAMGIDGFILSWLDYAEELEYFGERVMPLLRQAGLRV
ncbi:MAG: LLM class flavin-dependent oxidoreductase [Proteobacteria bacterium]|jgi:FMNH2-dependent dimethyl sulfone monooxygenase|nr:LLM class flavin-dependent oxidoreductase [Pseudomonadota bacterium]MBK8957231.1 LLM class flavin-dependent oxidoreductase [Pseudomonadota bacterium]